MAASQSAAREAGRGEETLPQAIARMQRAKIEGDRKAAETNGKSSKGSGRPEQREVKRKEKPESVRYGQPLAEILESEEIPYRVKGLYSVMSASTVKGICRLTTPEIARRCPISRASAYRHLQELARHGVVRNDGTERSPKWHVRVKGHETLP